MVSFSDLTKRVATASFIVAAAAHPGEHHDHAAIERAILQRDEYARLAQRSLSQCSNSTKHQAMTRSNVERRAHQLQKLRSDRGVVAKPQKYRRDLATLKEFEEG